MTEEMERDNGNQAALYEAMSRAQAQMTHAKLDGANPHFKSKYASLQSIHDAIRGPMTENGLGWYQKAETRGEGQVVVHTVIFHKEGGQIASHISMNPVKNDPQGIGSAITYARRYSLAAMTGIAAEDDDDGNGASQAPKPRTQPQTRETSQRASEAPKTAPEAPDGEIPAWTQNPGEFPIEPWEQMEIHFGKLENTRLGDLAEDRLKWWITEWKPKPYRGEFDRQDLRLYAALRLAEQGPTPDQDNIPF